MNSEGEAGRGAKIARPEAGARFSIGFQFSHTVHVEHIRELVRDESCKPPVEGRGAGVGRLSPRPSGRAWERYYRSIENRKSRKYRAIEFAVRRPVSWPCPITSGEDEPPRRILLIGNPCALCRTEAGRLGPASSI